MKTILALVLCLFGTVALAGEYKFEGPWKTTNRRLDGVQTCIVTWDGKESWSGRFYGIWQGVDFDYTVKFQGPPHALKGTAVIDGARYSWTGTIDREKFVGSFTGDRYTGSFNMARKK